MMRHLEERTRRSNVVLNQVWGIGEWEFKADFKMRMFLWESLVLGMLLYGVELWGFRERREVERLQLKYIKWTLGLDMRTPDSAEETEEGKNKGESRTEGVEFWGKNKGKDEKAGIDRMLEGKTGEETENKKYGGKGEE